MVKHTSVADELFQCVWPFRAFSLQQVNYLVVFVSELIYLIPIVNKITR